MLPKTLDEAIKNGLKEAFGDRVPFGSQELSIIHNVIKNFFRQFILRKFSLSDDSPQLTGTPPQKSSQQQRTSQEKNNSDQGQSVSTLSEKQIKRLFAIAYKSGWSNDDVKNFILAAYRSDSTKKLSKKHYEHICETMPKMDFEMAMKRIPAK